MATELLPVASTATDSADIVLAENASATVGIKGAATGATIKILMSDGAGGYAVIGQLRQAESEQVAVVSGPGTFRLRRVAGRACGAFSG